MQEFTIETSSGFVKAIRTIGGELNEVTEYTNDRNLAKRFTKKSMAKLLVRSWFKYYGMTVIIAEL